MNYVPADQVNVTMSAMVSSRVDYDGAPTYRHTDGLA